ncbi:MAG TPA: hypothetical protein EYP10_05430, partial [Armatimonadetes bacterium]|nr:hypothetical protein [Armatimonadota bacterium]
MPWCPKCNAEYVDGVTVCADCGIELVSEPPKREAHQAMRKVHDVVVYATSDPYDARIVQSLLRASGIPSLLRNGLEVIGLPSERYA